MKKLALFSMPFMALSLILSCSNVEEDNQEAFKELINLQVGNYWVYEEVSNFSNVPMDTSFKTIRVDSFSVVAKSMIDGRDVYELDGSFNFAGTGTNLVYDSLNYLKSYPSGLVLFTTDQSFMDVQETEVTVGQFMARADEETIEVPAGVFITHNYAGSFVSKEANYPHGTLTSNMHFSKDVGFVKSTAQYYGSGSTVEKRLIRFGKI